MQSQVDVDSGIDTMEVDDGEARQDSKRKRVSFRSTIYHYKVSLVSLLLQADIIATYDLHRSVLKFKNMIQSQIRTIRGIWKQARICLITVWRDFV